MADDSLVTCPMCKSQVQRAALVRQCDNCGKDVEGIISPGGDVYCSAECFMEKLHSRSGIWGELSDSLGNMTLVAQAIIRTQELSKEDSESNGDD